MKSNEFACNAYFADGTSCSSSYETTKHHDIRSALNSFKKDNNLRGRLVASSAVGGRVRVFVNVDASWGDEETF